MACMFLQLLMICCIIFSLAVDGSAYTIFFKKSHRKKSELVRSKDLGHHSTWPQMLIHLRGNRRCKYHWTILLLWASISSCWNIRCLVCRSISSKKLDNLCLKKSRYLFELTFPSKKYSSIKLLFRMPHNTIRLRDVDDHVWN